LPYQDVRPLLQRHKGTGVYFSGHAHFHAVVRQGSWHYVQTSSPIREPGFRIVEVDRERIAIRTVAIREASALYGAETLYARLTQFYRPPAPPPAASDLEFTIEVKAVEL